MSTRFTVRLLALIVSIDAIGVTADARALGPVDVEVAGTAGGATNPVAAPDPLGFELGARSGVSFRHFYTGLAFSYSLGSTASAVCVGPVLVACTTTTVTSSAHSVRYGIDGGYDIDLLPRLRVRPAIGVGILSFHESSPVQIVVAGALASLDRTASTAYLEPQATATLSFGAIFAGVDAGLLILPGWSRSNAALDGHGDVGVRF